MLSTRDVVSLEPYIRHTLVPVGVQTSYGTVGLAVFDYAWQCWQFEKRLRMCKHVVKEDNQP